MGDRVWRKVGWAAVWIAVMAVGVRLGLDGYRAVPDPPQLPTAFDFSDRPASYDLLYLFARYIALVVPLAVLLTAVHVWRSDARERAGRSRPRIFR